KDSFNRGAHIDEYDTPVGNTDGAFVHANYVESLNDYRISSLWGKDVNYVIEILISLLVAIIFYKKLSLLSVLVCLISILFILVTSSYFLLHAFAIYFDFFITTVLLFGHISTEIIHEWYEKAHSHGASQIQVQKV